MRVRERKQWEESEGLPANWAATATDANPIVILIVRLLAAANFALERGGGLNLGENSFGA